MEGEDELGSVTCSQFPCHPAVTFHLLASERKPSAGTLQNGGGPNVSVTLKKMCLQGLNDQSRKQISVSFDKNIKLKRQFSIKRRNLIHGIPLKTWDFSQPYCDTNIFMLFIEGECKLLNS